MESTAIQQAARYAGAVAEFRTLYTSEVAKAAVAHGLQVTHDYQNKAGAIPLPATLSMLLGNRLAEKESRRPDPPVQPLSVSMAPDHLTSGNLPSRLSRAFRVIKLQKELE